MLRRKRPILGCLHLSMKQSLLHVAQTLGVHDVGMLMRCQWPEVNFAMTVLPCCARGAGGVCRDAVVFAGGDGDDAIAQSRMNSRPQDALQVHCALNTSTWESSNEHMGETQLGPWHTSSQHLAGTRGTTLSCSRRLTPLSAHVTDTG